MNRPIYFYAKIYALVVLIFLFYASSDGASPIIIWLCLFIFYMCYASALLNPTVLRNNIPSFVNYKIGFLTFFYLLYFQPYQLYVLGFDTLAFSYYFTKAYEHNSNVAIISSTVAVLAFCIGSDFPVRSGSLKPQVSQNWHLSKSLSLVGSMALVALLAVYFGMGWRSTGEGSYTNTQTGGILADGIVAVILMICMLLMARAVFVFFATRRVDLMTIFGFSISLGWALRLLSFGDRNSFLLIITAGVAPAAAYLVRISRTTLLAGLVAMLFIYNGIEAYRSPSFQYYESPVEALASAFSEDNNRESSFNISSITFRATFDLVPAQQDFALGLYKVVGVLGIVPFIRGLIFEDSLQFDTTAAALTDFMLPPNAGWSVGTGILADLYLDFGIFGIVFGSIFIGWFGAAVERHARKNPFNEKSAIIYALTVSLIMELPRYSADFPVRIIAWALIVIWAARLIDTIHTRVQR